MNKITLLLVGVIFSAFALTFSSCKKKDDENSSTATNGKATIKGQVTAPLDLTNSSTEMAPAGTVILAKINSMDLVSNPNNSNYADIVYSTTVDGNGNYEIQVDANAKPVSVTIMPQDFIADQVAGTTTSPTTQRKVYTASQATTSVVKGGTQVVDIAYN
jgi:hypothetical protein